MKKITYLIISFIFMMYINACTGYKPIYTTNLQFKIADYSIKANKKLGNRIYSKLYYLTKPNENNPEARSIAVIIETTKDKSPAVKNSKGNVLEYRITLNSVIIIKDFLTDDKIVNQNFSYSTIYKVQERNFETIKLENKTVENLIDRIYQNLLIKMSENILTK